MILASRRATSWRTTFARALARSACARAVAARWFRTDARLLSRSAWAWFALASKIEGSIRAISMPFVTGELKSTRSCWIVPDTCVPTWTVTTAFKVPVDEMVEINSPRSTAAVR